MNKYLYLLLYPNHSLIASQLEPTRFAQHYAQGSTGFFGGNFLFAEVNPEYRNDYFKIEAAFAELKPHEDGRPKATKYICNYRTLEHLDFDALQNLYYCNAHGNFVVLKADLPCPPSQGGIKGGSAGGFPPTFMGGAGGGLVGNENDNLNIYLDINPTKMVVLSRYNFMDYGKFSTDPASLVSAPVLLYTQVSFDIDDFLTQFETNPFLPLRIPNIHPSRMRDAINEVRNSQSKNNKGISLDCPFDKISYRSLRLGFMFVSKDKTKFYPLVPMPEVEKDFYKFWKSM